MYDCSRSIDKINPYISVTAKCLTIRTGNDGPKVVDSIPAMANHPPAVFKENGRACASTNRALVYDRVPISQGVYRFTVTSRADCGYTGADTDSERVSVAEFDRIRAYPVLTVGVTSGVSERGTLFQGNRTIIAKCNSCGITNIELATGT
ncbi:hypothetical protein ACSFE6_13145 [Pseudomonas baetica]|uniref:hypothetical protein n=1 Tax=Pseudomonas baetica TaxID=674054 RepID=UPI003EEA9993